MTDYVWVRVGRYKSGGTDTVYHTSGECRYVTDSHAKKSVEVVSATEWRECSVCAGNDENGAKEQQSALRYQV